MLARTKKRQRRLRVFISGPVSEPLAEHGYLYVYNKFLNAQEVAWRLFPNAKIHNPMMLCNANWSWLRCMVVCLFRLMFSDVVLVMPGSEESRGSRIEVRTARKLKKTIVKIMRYNIKKAPET
ncbi:MAG: DUF4406 domain-containing protein [Bacteroidales bacterium]|nr:DUF4406 domain-containing protein [Bacteroidales bacterium]